MLEKKIKYTDYNDVEREETFYFNISKAELSRKEFTTEGGYSKFLERISQEKNSTELYKIFEEIICLAYGEKSDDGKRFIKERNGGFVFFSLNGKSGCSKTENYKHSEARRQYIPPDPTRLI